MCVCVYKSYILSSTERLFCCITTHQCGETRELFEYGIENWPTLHQPDNLPHSHQQTYKHNKGTLTHMYHFSFFICAINGYRVLNS